MAKQEKTPEIPSAPDINPDNIDLDIEDTQDQQTQPEKSQTIEEAEAAATPTQAEEDDAIFREASKDMATEPTDTSPQKSKPKKSKKKFVLTLLIIILLAAGSYAAWYFFLREKPVQQAVSSDELTGTQTVELNHVPETVAYAYKDVGDNPYTLFWRPASGGDRSQVEILNRSEVPTRADAYGAHVVFVADEKVYASTDYGKSYQSIFEAEAGAVVTDVKLSSDGNRVAIGYNPDGKDKNTVKSINLDGQDAKDIFTADKGSVDVLGWTDDRIVYTENCFECDGSSPTPYERNIQNNKVSALLEGVNLTEIAAMQTSEDVSKFLYVQGANLSEETSVVSPYTVKLITLDSSETTELATVGSADEKNPNGTAKVRDIKVGFLAGSIIPYYVDGNTLYTVSGTEPNAFYKSDKDIQFVPFASEKHVITGAGDSSSDYSLTNFDIEKSEATAIFQGDANTIILGVTTK